MKFDLDVLMQNPTAEELGKRGLIAYINSLSRGTKIRMSESFEQSPFCNALMRALRRNFKNKDEGKI